MDEFYKNTSEALIQDMGYLPDTVITGKPRLHMLEYINAIISTESAEEARAILGISETTIRRFTSKYLRPLFPEWSPGRSWHIILLYNIGYKKCNNCEIVYSLDSDMFGANKNRMYNLSGTCRKCDSERGKQHRDSNRQYYREHARAYYANNKAYFFAYNALRRAKKLQACPSWSNLAEIEDIYKNRPPGHHVDHIIPLTNKWVCGLHVPNNLQYLPAKDNLEKSNKFEFEFLS
jgi:hypothetical protein